MLVLINISLIGISDVDREICTDRLCSYNLILVTQLQNQSRTNWQRKKEKKKKKPPKDVPYHRSAYLKSHLWWKLHFIQSGQGAPELHASEVTSIQLLVSGFQEESFRTGDKPQ